MYLFWVLGSYIIGFANFDANNQLWFFLSHKYFLLKLCAHRLIERNPKLLHLLKQKNVHSVLCFCFSWSSSLNLTFSLHMVRGEDFFAKKNISKPAMNGRTFALKLADSFTKYVSTIGYQDFISSSFYALLIEESRLFNISLTQHSSSLFLSSFLTSSFSP